MFIDLMGRNEEEETRLFSVAPIDRRRQWVQIKRHETPSESEKKKEKAFLL